ncbi:DGQHR domain-containing protein [Croceibacter atlanticus]|uniref:DGQHR domain-containing protein n=1 Tax=Croceibacter atlanticus TaxID=313588 RepID=UPI001C5F4E89|nr:DGQHR domain-containing protein [Croceibacter atlanticus]MBW4971362.1 DGQHR domain-containing protein [Croceibacter atlanticus]
MRRLEDKEEGYQRSFSKSRINQIKKYIDKEGGILPNSILVNIDDGVSAFNNETSILTMDDSIDNWGFIIDGQHRVWGSNEAEKNLLLPVVATVSKSIEAQAQLFVKINKTQRGVPVSLYLDLLDITEGVIEDFDSEDATAQRRAIEIAKRLNDDEDSPMYDLIRMTGDTGRGISLSEMVSRLKPHIDPKKGNLLNYGFEHQFLIIKIYLKAVKSVFIEEWNNTDSLLLKTVGFGGLMNAFYEIFTLTVQNSKKFSTDNVIELLSKISDLKFDTDTFPGGGIKAQQNAATIIVTKLKKAIKGDDSSNIIIED